MSAYDYLLAAGWLPPPTASDTLWTDMLVIDQTIKRYEEADAVRIQRGRDAAVLAERERCIGTVRAVCTEAEDEQDGVSVASLAFDIEQRIRERSGK